MFLPFSVFKLISLQGYTHHSSAYVMKGAHVLYVTHIPLENG